MNTRPSPFFHNAAVDLTDDPASRAIALGLAAISEQLDFLICLLAGRDKHTDSSVTP